MPCKTLAILLSAFSYKKGNGYLGVVIDVSRAFHHRTQLNDALIESYGAYIVELVLRVGAVNLSCFFDLRMVVSLPHDVTPHWEHPKANGNGNL